MGGVFPGVGLSRYDALSLKKPAQN